LSAPVVPVKHGSIQDVVPIYSPGDGIQHGLEVYKVYLKPTASASGARARFLRTAPHLHKRRMFMNKIPRRGYVEREFLNHLTLYLIIEMDLVLWGIQLRTMFSNLSFPYLSDILAEDDKGSFLGAE
jgi:hypothetical protein